MNLKAKVYLLFILFMIFGSLGSLYFYNYSTSEIIEQQNINYLGVVAQSRADHIENLITTHKQFVTFLANDHHIQNFILEHENSSVEDLYRDFNLNYFAFKYTNLEGVPYELFILNSEGLVIDSTDKDNIGSDKSNDEYFIFANDKGYVKKIYFSNSTNQNSFAISSIVREGNTGKVIGVVGVRFGIELLEKVTLERIGLGLTGESYLVNSKNFLASSPRFGNDLVLKQKVYSSAVNRCILRHIDSSADIDSKDDLTGYLDYRGVEVLGGYAYISSLDSCLIVEIDKVETLEKLNMELYEKLILTLIGIGFLTIIFTRILNYYIFKSKFLK